MKELENKTTSMIDIVDGKEVKLKYSDLIAFASSQIPQGGYSMDDIEKRLRIRKACKNGKKKLQIEEGDVPYFKKMIQDSKWTAIHEDIIAFKEDVDQL